MNPNTTWAISRIDGNGNESWLTRQGTWTDDPNSVAIAAWFEKPVKKLEALRKQGHEVCFEFRPAGGGLRV